MCDYLRSISYSEYLCGWAIQKLNALEGIRNELKYILLFIEVDLLQSILNLQRIEILAKWNQIKVKASKGNVAHNLFLFLNYS